uniref:Secreted protein n=1 Tax=Anopheles coluzzii TaxID=1518534 RepID=A0A8W7PGP4_ANOCL
MRAACSACCSFCCCSFCSCSVGWGGRLRASSWPEKRRVCCATKPFWGASSSLILEEYRELSLVLLEPELVLVVRDAGRVLRQDERRRERLPAVDDTFVGETRVSTVVLGQLGVQLRPTGPGSCTTGMLRFWMVVYGVAGGLFTGRPGGFATGFDRAAVCECVFTKASGTFVRSSSGSGVREPLPPEPRRLSWRLSSVAVELRRLSTTAAAAVATVEARRTSSDVATLELRRLSTATTELRRELSPRSGSSGGTSRISGTTGTNGFGVRLPPTFANAEHWRSGSTGTDGCSRTMSWYTSELRSNRTSLNGVYGRSEAVASASIIESRPLGTGRSSICDAAPPARSAAGSAASGRSRSRAASPSPRRRRGTSSGGPTGSGAGSGSGCWPSRRSSASTSRRSASSWRIFVSSCSRRYASLRERIKFACSIWSAVRWIGSGGATQSACTSADCHCLGVGFGMADGGSCGGSVGGTAGSV